MIDPMPGVYMGTADKPGAPLFRGLGVFHHKISTRNKLTQRYFDQGIKLTFGFNHAEAIKCFGKALEHDPACAMAQWGIAYAAGPNYNLPWHLYDPAGKAQALAAGGLFVLGTERHESRRKWTRSISRRSGG